MDDFCHMETTGGKDHLNIKSFNDPKTVIFHERSQLGKRVISRGGWKVRKSCFVMCSGIARLMIYRNIYIYI